LHAIPSDINIARRICRWIRNSETWYWASEMRCVIAI